MTKYEEYINIESQLRALKAKQDALRNEILESMKTEKKNIEKTDFGTFSVMTRKQLEFDDYAKGFIKKAKAQVKQEELLMINSGHGNITEIQTVRFTPKKEA